MESESESESDSEDSQPQKNYNNNNGEIINMDKNAEDCEICLCPMSKIDLKIPIECPTSTCSFNMCTSCVQHLIGASKQDFEEASDGNLHVKVRLQCPQCRGNLSPIIFDVVLIRESEIIENDLFGIPDDDLSGQQLRAKYSIDSESLKNAKERLLKYRTLGIAELGKERNQNSPSSKSRKTELLDYRIFDGLECAMSDAERIYVTELMTSGDTDKLAMAAQILSDLSKVMKKGYIPSNPDPIENDIYKLCQKKTPEERAMEYVESRVERKDEQLRRDKIASHRRRNPLPLRMPRHVELAANFDMYAQHRKVLKFRDDMWNGTMADAFARAQCVEDGDPHDTKSHHRVIVAAARKQAFQEGIREGDVVN